MSCPYFKEGYFGICVAPGPDAIHVPSIDEMERLCFRSWYHLCPNIAFIKDEGKEKSRTADGPPKISIEQTAGPLSGVAMGSDAGGSHR